MTDPIIATTSGRIRGVQCDGFVRFRGIPYAAPPTGPRRFAPPQPAARWEGIRDTVEPGPTAPQSVRPVPGLDLSPITGPGWRRGSDYLTVDVSTPDPGGGGLPVMVFVHGGAFVRGTGSAPAFDGAGFARAGVVLVTINYRLGVEGFLPLKGGSTNIGLRDQIAALRWLRENAQAFGGDHDKITVFGHSAGAVSISCLLAAPQAARLFRRAIVQSGHPEMIRPLEQAHRLAERVAAELGVPATAEAFRSVTPEALLAAQTNVAIAANGLDLRDAQGYEPSYGLAAFLPVLGDEVIPEPPNAPLARGLAAGVDLVVGTCSEEMALYLLPPGTLESIDDHGAIAVLQALHPQAIEVLRSHGLGRADVRPGDALLNAMTDLAFRAPARRLASSHTGRTFCYEFAWRSPNYAGRLGACHGLELPFVFGTLDSAVGFVGAEPPRVISERIQRAWVDFAASGDPGWPEYRTERLVWRVDIETRLDRDDALTADHRPARPRSPRRGTSGTGAQPPS